MQKIKHTDYQGLCDFTFEGGDLPPSGKVYVPMDHIYEFFSKILDSKNEYVVVSANSDFSFCYQEQNSVQDDMKKWLNFISLDDIGYEDVNIPARCFKQFCKITDKYSIKVHTFTKATIDFIPDCVKTWYCTNNEVEDDRVVRIPFGVPDWTHDLLFKQRKKEVGVYVNCQPNNLARAEILKSNNPLFVKSGEVDKPTYVSHLQKYSHVLCPPGNGLDTFRVCEALYCGSIPIVFNTPHNEVYGDHVIRINSLGDIIPDLLNIYPNSNLENSVVDFSYWRKEIE